MERKIIVIGSENFSPAINTLLESAKDDVMIVDVDSLDTLYPELKRTTPMVIKAPPIIERTFEDYKTGQEKRRERRAKKRKDK